MEVGPRRVPRPRLARFLKSHEEAPTIQVAVAEGTLRLVDCAFATSRQRLEMYDAGLDLADDVWERLPPPAPERP